jgi:hypothetical protein
VQAGPPSHHRHLHLPAAWLQVQLLLPLPLLLQLAVQVKQTHLLLLLLLYVLLLPLHCCQQRCPLQVCAQFLLLLQTVAVPAVSRAAAVAEVLAGLTLLALSHAPSWER